MAVAQVTDSTQRKVKVQGAINLRDLGGYQTTDGKTVKWGKLYRSADISKRLDEQADNNAKRWRLNDDGFLFQYRLSRCPLQAFL